MDGTCVREGGQLGEWRQLTGQLMCSLGGEVAGLEVQVEEVKERQEGIKIVNSNCFQSNKQTIIIY